MEDCQKFIIESDKLELLLGSLHSKNYRIIGPSVKDQAVVYDFITDLKDLPTGISDEQNNGHYRIHKTTDETVFAGYTVGQNSAKKFIYPPIAAILKIQKNKKGHKIENPDADSLPPLAFIGLRACDLAALKILDKVLQQEPHLNRVYNQYRKDMLIIAVNCGKPGATCFCDSMHTGPAVADGFDLALTEIDNDGRPYFILTAGSEKGLNLIQPLSLPTASEEQLSNEAEIIKRARSKMGRHLSTETLEDILAKQFDNPHWDEIAARCLSCGNCTMVCPTCFCTDLKDETDLTGDISTRTRQWDSCHNSDFSYIHGGSIRTSGKSRYRQWMMHKLSYWKGQFDEFGCVGCGRCITWCPVGIDITEEAASIGTEK